MSVRCFVLRFKRRLSICEQGWFNQFITVRICTGKEGIHCKSKRTSIYRSVPTVVLSFFICEGHTPLVKTRLGDEMTDPAPSYLAFKGIDNDN
jgi:hypothetical protein